MSALDHGIAPPSSWANAWIEREWEPLQWYIVVVCIGLTFAMVFTQLRGTRSVIKARKELDVNPSDRAAILKEMHKRALKTDRSQFKIAVAFMLNTLCMVLVDGGISALTLAKDAKENPEAWNTRMYMEIATYVSYLFVLFLASFVFIPMLQMLFVTWLLTRAGQKNKLSDYVPQARACSSAFALMWASICFGIVCAWPVGSASDDTATRFFILEASWGSTLAWLEAAFLFNYASHAIGDKDISNNSRVAEIVSLFAKAAMGSFSKEKEAGLPRYEAPQTQPLLAKD